MKRIKKGFTMMEMVSSIAVTAVLVLSLSSLIIFASRTQGIIHQRDRKYQGAIELKQQITSLIDQHQSEALLFSSEGRKESGVLFSYQDHQGIAHTYEFKVNQGKSELLYQTDSLVIQSRTIYKASQAFWIGCEKKEGYVLFTLEEKEKRSVLSFSVYVRKFGV